MTVDFNNLRKRLVFAIDDVIITLNASKLKETEFGYREGVHRKISLRISRSTTGAAQRRHAVVKYRRQLRG